MPSEDHSKINLENPVIYVGKERNNLISKIMSKYDFANSIKNIPDYMNPQISENFNDTALLDSFILRNRKKQFILLDSKFSKKFYLKTGTKRALTLISNEYALNMGFGLFFDEKNEINKHEHYNIQWINPKRRILIDDTWGCDWPSSKGSFFYKFKKDHESENIVLNLLNSGLSFIQFMESDKQTKENVPFVKQSFRTFINSLQKEKPFGDFGRYYQNIDKIKEDYKDYITIGLNNINKLEKYDKSLNISYEIEKIKQDLE